MRGEEPTFPINQTLYAACPSALHDKDQSASYGYESTQFKFDSFKINLGSLGLLE